jgi:hypothetical protein
MPEIALSELLRKMIEQWFGSAYNHKLSSDGAGASCEAPSILS